MEVPDIEDVKAMSRAIKNYAKAIEEREKVRNDDFREYSLGDEALEEYLIKLSFDIESTSNFILDEIKDIKKNIN